MRVHRRRAREPAEYKAQARCAAKRVAEILDRLKELGVYDNTFVVISSDHGIGMPSPRFANNKETPMGDYREDRRQRDGAARRQAAEQQRSRSHFPCADNDHRYTRDNSGRYWSEADLAGPARAQASGDARRVRPGRIYDWERDDWGQNYFPTLDIVDINGRVLDGNNWTLLDTIYEPDG